jgi:hypothetical protein
MLQTSALPPLVASSGDVTSIDDSLPPTTGGVSKFGEILGKVAITAANIAAPGLGSVLGGRFSSGLMNNDPMQYLEMQQQMLSEARAFETVSNVQKAKHDSAMAAIRNLLPQ